MLSLQRTLSLGYLKRRWLRAVLIVLSIALGVSAIVATSILNGGLKLAAQRVVNPLAGLADLMVGNNQAGVPLAVADQLDPARAESETSPLAAISSVQPLVISRVALPEHDNLSTLLLGLRVDQQGQEATSPELPAGLEVRWLTGEVDRLTVYGLWRAGLGPVPVLVSEPLARKLGLAVGQGSEQTASSKHFRIRMAGQECQARPLGLVRSTSQLTHLEPNVIVMPAGPAARLVYSQRPEYVTWIYLTLKPGADKEAIGRQLRQLLQPPLQVATIEKSNEAIRDVTAGLELAFAVGSSGALVIGLFLVYNAFSVSVTERRRDIGILRSMGATRSQIARLFLGEAWLLGLAGSLLGLPAGLGLAYLARGPINRALSSGLAFVDESDAGPFQLSWLALSLALSAGLAVTTLAALAPALQAAGAEPIDGIRRSPPGNRSLSRLIQVCGCLLVLLVGLGCVLWREWLPIRWGVFAGIVCILLAGLIATPLLSEVAGRFLRPCFCLFLGLEGRLAADNLARSPVRTGLVIAALAATGGLLVQTAGFIRSTESALLTHLEESLAADLFVTACGPATRIAETSMMDESLRDELLALPGIDAVLGIRFHTVQYRNRVVALVALDTHAFEGADSTPALARHLTHFPELGQRPDVCLVSENFAALYRIKVGDTVTIPGLVRPLELQVLGIVVDYTWNRGSILVDRRWYREQFRDRQVNVFDIYLKHPSRQTPGSRSDSAGRTAEVRALLEQRLQSKEGVYAVTRAELRESVVTQLRRVYGLAYAQQAVVGVVALLGVVSALFISVLQRRREARLAARCGCDTEPGAALGAGRGGVDGRGRVPAGTGTRSASGVVRD